MTRISGLILGSALALALSSSASAQKPMETGAANQAPASKAGTIDPASLALAHQILAISFPPEQRADMMASVMDSISQQTRATMQSQFAVEDKDFQELIDRSLRRMHDQMIASVNESLPDYFEAMARAYARGLSREDLEAVLAFVKTPAGQHYFSRLPMLLKDPDVQAAGERMSKQLLAKLPEMNREMMRDVEDYVAKKQKEEKAAAPTPVS